MHFFTHSTLKLECSAKWRNFCNSLLRAVVTKQLSIPLNKLPCLDHKEFTCDICAKGLRTLRSLRKHLFTKHQIEFDGKEKESILRDLNRKPKMKPVEAECLNCHYKTFNSIADFNKHVLICYGAKLTDTNHDVEFIWWVVEFSNFVIQN